MIPDMLANWPAVLIGTVGLFVVTSIYVMFDIRRIER